MFNQNQSIEDKVPRAMMLANSSVQEEEENYSSDQISPDVSIVKSSQKMVPDSEYQDHDDYSDDYSEDSNKGGRDSNLNKENLERMQKSLKDSEKQSKKPAKKQK